MALVWTRTGPGRIQGQRLGSHIVPALAGACPQEVDCGLRTQGAENSPLRPSPVSGGLKGPVVTRTWFQPFNCGL